MTDEPELRPGEETLEAVIEGTVFRNVENGAINVVYRRRDGDYGLLIPEDK